jgi:hypothetical protein
LSSQLKDKKKEDSVDLDRFEEFVDKTTEFMANTLDKAEHAITKHGAD